ncbi:hypothetical protein C2G38_2233793 [Gigaspora rosea]|uniref:Uncharacterized protein n=1 Tax=Gigaspora rosea TaxID=44941 RepID=A0A397TV58_9GLOM|nr:hypothetical protein C2G38_2233793 [Gigaspora rosea]
MQQKLERRWADWEQPLLFLAINFHPQYRVQALFDTNFFSLERITKWVEYYYEMCNERFENTLKAILAEKVETNNANGLALLRYWEFAAIDQKEIECLDNAEKVRQAVTINRITSPTNKSNTESSSANNSNVKSSSTNKSNVESRPVDKLNSELDGPNQGPGQFGLEFAKIYLDVGQYLDII